jgi:hypothetical protein
VCTVLSPYLNDVSLQPRQSSHPAPLVKLHYIGTDGITSLAAAEHDIEGGITSLASCLLQPDPGLSCPLATSLLVLPGRYRPLADGTRPDYSPQHYIGVLQAVPPDHQDPHLKEDVYRCVAGRSAEAGALGLS